MATYMDGPHRRKVQTKRKARKSTAQRTESVRHLRYHLTTSGSPGTETSHFIDLARDLSIVNRRLYRQGRDYHVKKVTIVSSDTPNGGNRVSVSAAGDSWSTRGAWKRAKQVWDNMNKDASANLAGNIAGTWADFKVYLSNDMKSATLPLPLDNGSNAAILNEWIYSDLVSPDGTTSADTFDIGLLGDHVGAAGSRTYVGLVKSFGESRATVQENDPTVPVLASADPLANVFDYGTTLDEVVDNLEADNDSPPYDIADYVGGDGNMPKPIVLQDTTIVGGQASMSGFNAICGLLEFEIKSAAPNDTYSVLIELAPGKYRGIKAEAI